MIIWGPCKPLRGDDRIWNTWKVFDYLVLGGGAYSVVAWLSRMTIDLASLARLLGRFESVGFKYSCVGCVGRFYIGKCENVASFGPTLSVVGCLFAAYQTIVCWSGHIEQ